MSEEGGTFGSLLRGHRLGANLTQAALAARSGVSIAEISMLERGERVAPRRSTVEALAHALRLTDPMREVLIAAAEAHPSASAGRNRFPVHRSYPLSIGEDWREAHAALAGGLPRAAAAMAGRAVYAVCAAGGASGDRPIDELIEELGRISTLHPTLVEWAHGIRLFRCTPAQALTDEVGRVTIEEATTVVAFLDELLRLLYEMPDRLARLKAEAEADLST